MARVSGSRSVSIAYGPQAVRDRMFCERYLVHFDHLAAYREAGFKWTSETIHSRAKAKLERFAAYLQPLQEAKSRKVGEQLAIDETTVLEAMAAKALFDPADFVETSTEPLKVRVSGPDGKEIEQIVRFNGEPVYPDRFKPLSKLTRKQRLAAEVYQDKFGRVCYALPSGKVQHQYVESVGRQLGMFNEKIILERHSHKHKTVKLDLTGVPTDQLEQMTRMLLPLLGEDFARELGVEDMLTVPAKGHA